MELNYGNLILYCHCDDRKAASLVGGQSINQMIQKGSQITFLNLNRRGIGVI